MPAFTLPFQTLFTWALKRDLEPLIKPEGTWLDLGAGNSIIPGSAPLDLPDWNGETDPIPYKDESVDAITAFHFLEHLPGAAAVRVLRECQRVLRPGGSLTVCVPHALAELAVRDLDHKSFWTESTWRTLFNTQYYTKLSAPEGEEPWRFRIHFNIVVGEVQRNLIVLTQLIKE